MDPLAELLAGGPSGLGRLGQAALAGLRATLLHGLAQADANDAHRPAVLAALAYLDRLPGGAAAAPQFAPPATVESPLPDPVTSWPRLLAEWRARPDGTALAKMEADSPSLAKDLWLFTCRLASPTAAGLREAWNAVGGGTGAPNPGATVDGRLGAIPATPVASRMFDVVNRLLWFSDNDWGLHHMLRSVYRFGLIALTAAQRDRYTQALVNRYVALRQAEEAGDARALLGAWVDLDEATHSLLHQPIAHVQSDFARVARIGRDVLADVREAAVRAGISFHLQCPSGRYADLKGLTDPDSDVPVEAGGAPGDVVLCTRLFLRLDDVKHPGRVVYRPR